MCCLNEHVYNQFCHVWCVLCFVNLQMKLFDSLDYFETSRYSEFAEMEARSCLGIESTSETRITCNLSINSIPVIISSQEVLGKNEFQQWLTFQYNNNNNNNPVGKKPRRPHYASPTVFWIPTKGSDKINKKQRTRSDPRLFTGCLGTNSQSLWTYEWSSDGGNQGAKSSDLKRNVSLEKLHLLGFQSPPGWQYIWSTKKVNLNHHLPLESWGFTSHCISTWKRLVL